MKKKNGFLYARREVELLQPLEHPLIVKMSHAVQTQRHVYIGMEMCRGSLFDRIVEAGRLDEDETRAYWIQLLHAVKYLHNKEVCHLDLKPECPIFDG
eukprot:NODE_2565_length_1088_cov_16.658325_g2134_i0.p2 GENE.NODE_2565_length_1088_cov_16.658325_g2134_i0~~NODE_2565_length_1088_cov_16.658325_g2134_i0.p2  ORF type:complete len:114 (-),score=27.64 NODE_2565_length_1088_cov_16.658325_g2134_i0:745-1038(-)